MDDSGPASENHDRAVRTQPEDLQYRGIGLGYHRTGIAIWSSSNSDTVQDVETHDWAYGPKNCFQS